MVFFHQFDCFQELVIKVLSDLHLILIMLISFAKCFHVAEMLLLYAIELFQEVQDFAVHGIVLVLRVTREFWDQEGEMLLLHCALIFQFVDCETLTSQLCSTFLTVLYHFSFNVDQKLSYFMRMISTTHSRDIFLQIRISGNGISSPSYTSISAFP